jgi:hypothetical protein
LPAGEAALAGLPVRIPVAATILRLTLKGYPGLQTLREINTLFEGTSYE